MGISKAVCLLEPRALVTSPGRAQGGVWFKFSDGKHLHVESFVNGGQGFVSHF
jgi:hypothetical protein